MSNINGDQIFLESWDGSKTYFFMSLYPIPFQSVQKLRIFGNGEKIRNVQNISMILRSQSSQMSLADELSLAIVRLKNGTGQQDRWRLKLYRSDLKVPYDCWVKVIKSKLQGHTE